MKRLGRIFRKIKGLLPNSISHSKDTKVTKTEELKPSVFGVFVLLQSRVVGFREDF
jgi:hypothetical protein